MTEAEILFQFAYLQEQQWVEMQWIGTISLGLIALAHLRAKLLSWPIVVVLIVLYLAFFLFNLSSQAMRGPELLGLVEMLAQLEEEGALSAAGQGRLAAVKKWAPVMSVAGDTAVFGLVAGTVAYLIYSYLRVRKKP